MKNTVSEIKNWFQKAVPAPSDKNRAVQLGCHFEEVGEMLLAMGLNGALTAILVPLIAGWLV